MLVAILALAACISLLAAAIASAASSQLRQRNFQGDEPPDEEGQVLIGGDALHKRPTRVPAKPLLLTVALSAAVAITALVSIGVWMIGSGAGPGPGLCVRPPSVAARLKHAASLGYSHPVYTRSGTAQRLFDLGLIEEWNFNQPEAHAAFSAAAKADPSCSRCWWGVSYALGPGANRAVVLEPQEYPAFSPADFPATQAAALKAAELAQAALRQRPDDKVTQRDAEWGRAAAARFPNGSDVQPARDAAELDYAQQVAAIGDKWQDPDAWAIAAEAHMNLSPWDYYSDKNYTLKPNAVEAEKLIYRALAARPDHPLAAHLLIHVAEASSPLRGAPVSATRAEVPAARLLAAAGPAATMGHLLHMPSHTYVRIGRWHDAVLSNVRAYEADAADVAACRIPYVPEHNTDMLIYAAVQSGEGATAREWATRLRTFQDALHTAAYGDPSHEWTHLPLVQAAFGDWDAILAAPAPPPTARDNCAGPGGYQMAQAVWHYTRGLALAASTAGGQAAQHSQPLVDEIAKFEAAAALVPREAGTVPGEWPGIYGCDRAKLLRVYGSTLHAALKAVTGDLKTAEVQLTLAVAVEDDMGYMEPPRLLQTARYCLGAVLLANNHSSEAEQAFREDLATHPDNGRSLRGLAQALDAQQRSDEAQAVREGALAAAWRHADSPATPCAWLAQLPE